MPGGNFQELLTDKGGKMVTSEDQGNDAFHIDIYKIYGAMELVLSQYLRLLPKH